jgi:molecular chaperone Hsp33
VSDATSGGGDTLVHHQLFDYKARCALAITTEITREAQRRHQLDPLTTIAFGRAVSCAALLASTFKRPDEYVHCSFAGNGVMQKVLVECDGEGHCRGYVAPPQLAAVVADAEDMPASVGEALGHAGILTVNRGTRGGRGEASPYNAVCEFYNGEIASDVARYLTESEQIPSAVAAGVKLAPDGNVVAAGGVLVQRLGGAELGEELLQRLETKVGRELNISERIAAGAGAEEIVRFIDPSATAAGLLHQRPLRFQCSCSRERMATALYTLGEDELKDIRRETGKIEVRCPYCSDCQLFKLEELVKH